MIKLNGPDLDSFDAEPALLRWQKAAPRCHRPTSKPHGPRQADSETDSDSESDLD